MQTGMQKQQRKQPKLLKTLPTQTTLRKPPLLLSGLQKQRLKRQQRRVAPKRKILLALQRTKLHVGGLASSRQTTLNPNSSVAVKPKLTLLVVQSLVAVTVLLNVVRPVE